MTLPCREVLLTPPTVRYHTKATQHIPVPKTVTGSSCWSPLSPCQLLYSCMKIYNRACTHTTGAMVLWCTSTQNWNQHNLFLPEFFYPSDLLQKRAQLSSTKGNLMLHMLVFLIYWRHLDRCFNYFVDMVQRTLYTRLSTKKRQRYILTFQKLSKGGVK